MRITDPEMRRKFDRMIKDGLGGFTLDDIERHIDTGLMQSFTFGDTWVITQVHTFPQLKTLDMTMVVGHADDLLQEGIPALESYAREIGASYLTGSGREGWWRRRLPGWRNLGYMYAKDLRDG